MADDPLDPLIWAGVGMSDVVKCIKFVRSQRLLGWQAQCSVIQSAIDEIDAVRVLLHQTQDGLAVHDREHEEREEQEVRRVTRTGEHWIAHVTGEDFHIFRCLDQHGEEIFELHNDEKLWEFYSRLADAKGIALHEWCVRKDAWKLDDGD